MAFHKNTANEQDGEINQHKQKDKDAITAKANRLNKWYSKDLCHYFIS